MTSASLTWGCASLAFGPAMSLLFIVAYKKAQLIIVVTTAAFSFLLSALAASLIWFLFDLAGIGNNAFIILFPGVIFQCLFRCGFVALYHKVERVIQVSIRNHEEQAIRRGEQVSDPAVSESARLRLELNDWACALAAGTGFGGMHAILLYGTLLASESGNLGTLYQPSCPGIPALVLSAVHAFLFTILDVLWMLLTFFGMRRRRRMGESSTRSSGGFGAMFGDEKAGGNRALMFVLLSHFCATAATIPNNFKNGCHVSVPVLTAVTLVTGLVFWAGASGIYLPANQSRRANHLD